MVPGPGAWSAGLTRIAETAVHPLLPGAPARAARIALALGLLAGNLPIALNVFLLPLSGIRTGVATCAPILPSSLLVNLVRAARPRPHPTLLLLFLLAARN